MRTTLMFLALVGCSDLTSCHKKTPVAAPEEAGSEEAAPEDEAKPEGEEAAPEDEAKPEEAEPEAVPE